MKNDCKKHKIKDFNDHKHAKLDLDCSCEGANGSDRGEGMGPATDPALVAKRTKPLEHPETPEATGPAKQ